MTLVTLNFALLPPVWGHAGRPVFVYRHLALQQRGGRALCAQRVHVSAEPAACVTPHPLLLSHHTLHMRLFVLAERAWSSGSSSFSPPSASWGKLPITWLSGCHQKWCVTRCTYTHMPRIVAYATSIYSFLLLWRCTFVSCLLHFMSTNTQACTHAR